MIIYETKNRFVKEYNDESKLIHMSSLSILEGKLLEALCNNDFNSYEDINKYLYGCHDEYTMKSIRTYKKRILDKTKLNIRIFNTHGLMLTDEIYVM